MRIRGIGSLLPAGRAVTVADGATLCLCQADGGPHGVEVALGGEARRLDVSSQPARKVRRPVLAILPKSQYLVKTVDVPTVSPRELPAMLGLEIEASLPPEFGLAAISVFPLESAREGRLRFEVYVARDEVLRKLVESLASVGLHPDMILPSAVAWRGVLAERKDVHMLVAELPGNEMETAALLAAGGCTVRTIEGTGHGHVIAPGVIESIRSLRAAGNASEHHTVLWCGPAMPRQAIGAVQFEGAFGDGQSVDRATGNAADGASTLALAWRGIANLPAGLLGAASLSPRGQEEARQRNVVRRRLFIAAAAMVAAMLGIQLSLWILESRCRRAADDLDKKIAAISRQGEATEQRLKQLSAVSATAGRQEEFQHLLAALYEFTPPGISYSDIVMDANGLVKLRGQGQSMGQLLLLPRALEGKGMSPLTRVAVKDTGWSRNSGGMIAEFKAELTYRREARP